MKIKYSSYGDEYEVKDGTIRGRVTVTNLRSRVVFENYYFREVLNERIANGEVTVVEEDTKAVELKVGVDSSELANTLALAKELEATILRIRGMFK